MTPWIEPYQIVLAIVACFTAGFFITWFSTIGPEIIGDDAWRGNILLVNLFSALVGLISGFWSTFSIRLLRSPLKTNRGLSAITGCIAIQFLWVYAERLNDVPPFWTILEVLSTRYAVYFLLEALAGQIAWPIALLTCVYVCTRKNPERVV
jgi:uncharacterized protein YneF (UPF0154 family)